MISKSLFIRGMQCHKSLYLHIKRPYLRDKLSPEILAKFKRGHNVGRIARDLFPGGVILSAGGAKISEKTLALVHEHIEKGTPVLYEVPFQSDDLLAIMDILTFADGRWNAYEVKSSASISETFLWDITFQAYVIRKFGLNNTDFHLIHLHQTWNSDASQPVDELFNIVHVNQEIELRFGCIDDLVEQMKEVEKLKTSPDINVGDHCHTPYTCDFIGHCWKNIPK